MLRRLSLVVALGLSGLVAPAAAQGIPSTIEIRHREVVTHGSDCMITSVITILRQNVLYSLKQRKCGNNVRKPSLDEGQDFPLNRRTTTHHSCSIKAGTSPYKVCTDGERRKLTGMKFNQPIQLETDRTLESRVSSQGVFIKLDFNEVQYIGAEGKPKETKKVRQIWQWDVQFQNGGCKLVGVDKTLIENGKNHSPFAIGPVSCKVIG
jgi:hypothetical protein